MTRRTAPFPRGDGLIDKSGDQGISVEYECRKTGTDQFKEEDMTNVTTESFWVMVRHPSSP